jgi:hypothetical protein
LKIILVGRFLHQLIFSFLANSTHQIAASALHARVFSWYRLLCRSQALHAASKERKFRAHNSDPIGRGKAEKKGAASLAQGRRLSAPRRERPRSRDRPRRSSPAWIAARGSSLRPANVGRPTCWTLSLTPAQLCVARSPCSDRPPARTRPALCRSVPAWGFSPRLDPIAPSSSLASLGRALAICHWAGPSPLEQPSRVAVAWERLSRVARPQTSSALKRSLACACCLQKPAPRNFTCGRTGTIFVLLYFVHTSNISVWVQDLSV